MPVGEVYLPIQLHFLTLPGVKFEDIKTVISHPIALRQCVDFIDEYPQLKVVESNDTAACAKRVHDQQLTDTAAIANSLAAKLYNLEIMERRIESNKKNFEICCWDCKFGNLVCKGERIQVDGIL